ncbi:MAG: helix-turn-helix domain-containing protein [bacterium]|nr:helix-turn-helix domain-containing protein [bacterium]
MESIGEKLRAARNAKKLSVKEVSNDTNISPMYLEALEEEEFDKFPSETYLIGFLRSYTEYLKLDAEEVIQAYRGYKIGESVTPLEELTKPTKPSVLMGLSSFTNKYKNSLYVVAALAALFIIVWGFSGIFSSDVDIDGGNTAAKDIKNEHDLKTRNSEIKSLKNLQLQNNKGIILVYKKEAVQFPVGNKEVLFLLKELDANSIRIKLFPGEKRETVETIEMGKSKTLTLAGCPREVEFSLKGLTDNRAKIKVILGKKLEGAKDSSLEDTAAKEEGGDSTKVKTSTGNLKIVFEAEFTQKSFIELYLDGSKVKRGFIPKGTRERWEAKEYIQIKIGNAGGLNAKINNKEYRFGKSGQVANKVITWKKDVKSPNVYYIVVKDW